MYEAALLVVVTGLLWGLSVTSWTVILYKSWWLWRVARDLPLAQQAFWRADQPVQACRALTLLDRQAVLSPLAAQAYPEAAAPPALADSSHSSDQEARLRGVTHALREVMQRVRWGQAWLACVASSAPFVGLLGTVWALMEALGSLTWGPQTEASQWVPVLSQVLGLTAAGLVVALPALLAHHLLAPRLEGVQRVVEDFAAELMVHVQSGPPH